MGKLVKNVDLKGIALFSLVLVALTGSIEAAWWGDFPAGGWMFFLLFCCPVAVLVTVALLFVLLSLVDARLKANARRGRR